MSNRTLKGRTRRCSQCKRTVTDDMISAHDKNCVATPFLWWKAPVSPVYTPSHLPDRCVSSEVKK